MRFDIRTRFLPEILAWGSAPPADRLPIPSSPVGLCSSQPERRVAEIPIAPLRTFVLVVLLSAGAGPAAGQTVLGRLVDQGTGDPLVAAFVVLLDSTGVERGATLTNGEGRYVLRARGPGRYTIRAELIGYASHTSPPLNLATDETRAYDMAASFQAIELAAIEVKGEERCTVRPGSGLRTAEVWEEARKALRLTAWTGEQGAVRFRAVGFERDLDPQTLRVLSEQRANRSGYAAGSPYESLPAEDLAGKGYVRPEEDGTWIYFAPDAQVLLSDPFLDAHCFELTEHESRAELLGLAFRPVRRGDQADIRGVLWLDRQSSELRYLEFTYTNLPYPVESTLIGGRVDFARLISGPWIVRSWRIRVPQVAMGRQVLGALRVNEQRYRVTGIHEVGAEVQDVVGTEGAPLLNEAGGAGSMTGVVYDARGLTTVANAEVSLEGTMRRARTETDGTFEVHGLPEGLYELRVTPATWDLPWLPPVGTEVSVQEGDTSHVRVNLPSPEEVAHSLCGDVAGDTLPGVIPGQVIDAESGRPVSGREVVVTWGDFTVVDDALGIGMRVSWRGTTVGTDDNGWYLACGLPAEAPIRVRPVPLYDPTSDVTASRLWQPGQRMPPDARETQVGYGNPVGRVDLEVRQGNVREVRARLVDDESRNALAGPEVTLMAPDSTEIVRTTSGPDGFFTLSMAPGRYILRIEHPGYETLEQPFTLEGGLAALPAFVLRTTVIPLDPLVVEVDRGNVTLGGVERSARPAHVLAGEQMAVLERTGISFTSAIRDLGAGLRVRDVRINGRPYSCIESSRTSPSFGGGGSGCRIVAIIVDGVDTGLDGEETLRFVRTLQVQGYESIEFLSQLDAGLRYGSRAGNRGALLLWTRGRGPHQSKARGGGG